MLKKKTRKPLSKCPDRVDRVGQHPTTFALDLLRWFENGKKLGYDLAELRAACAHDVGELVEGDAQLHQIAANLGLIEAAPAESGPPPDPAPRRRGAAGRTVVISSAANGAAAAPPSGPVEGEFKLIKLTALSPHPDNPRKLFDEAKLAELAESIRHKGVLEPILCRPLSEGKWQVVAGERRLHAARLAGLKEVPCIVRPMSDQDAAEVMVTENDQRQDVTAGERADGYLLLVEKHGHTVESVAARIGKSSSTVRDLLRLARGLPADLRMALDRGQVSASVAGLVARVPAGESRNKLAEWVVRGIEEWRGGQRERRECSYREVKEMIRHDYTIELKGAPFSLKMVDLLPGAGSCEACPRRAGNLAKEDPDAYGDLRADVCTDPACYREKVEKWQVKMLAEASSKGQKVLDEHAAARLFRYGARTLPYDAVYFDLAEQCHEDHAKKTPRSYKQLLDGHVKDADVELAFDGAGSLHRLVHKDVALPVLRAEHGLFVPNGRPLTTGGKSTTAEEDRKERARKLQENREKRAIESALLEQVEARARAAFAVVGEGTTDLVACLRLLLPSILRGLHDGGEAVCRRRGLETGGGAYQCRDRLEALAPGLSVPELVALLVEAQAAAALFHWGSDKEGKELLADLEIDRKVVEREARAACRAEAQAPKGGKSKAKEAPETPPDKVATSACRPLCELSDSELGAACQAAAEAQEAAVADVAAERQAEAELLFDAAWDARLAELPGLAPGSLRRLIDAGILTISELRDEALMPGLPQAEALARYLGPDEGLAVADLLSAYLMEHGIPSCRVCGCTQDDCSVCVARTGEPCRWVGERLCSACVPGK